MVSDVFGSKNCVKDYAVQYFLGIYLCGSPIPKILAVVKFSRILNIRAYNNNTIFPYINYNYIRIINFFYLNIFNIKVKEIIYINIIIL